MKIKRGYFPEKDSNWLDRQIAIWEEDDARPPDAESLRTAFTRITGQRFPDNPTDARAHIKEFVDHGDACYYLMSNGWVIAICCDGCYIAVVAQTFE